MPDKIYRAWLRFAHRVVFHQLLSLGIFFIRLFSDRKLAKSRYDLLINCPENTLGHAVLAMLKAKSLRFVPRYENHDLKHALLGFRQEAPQEICMQAFMFGNAGFSVFSVLTFLVFVVWTPDVWMELSYHYRCGRLTSTIGHWRIEDYAHRDLEELRKEIGLERARTVAKRKISNSIDSQSLGNGE